ncbi:hypothetical protein [Dyadobacter crusticola]|uniref:hypothetical protein n=1 Tax=Dyadobacter crusticola TaxID=292407 RepID=UPI000A751C82|nr:hypothetical protein [Dyadobacter crusticola]
MFDKRTRNGFEELEEALQLFRTSRDSQFVPPVVVNQTKSENVPKKRSAVVPQNLDLDSLVKNIKPKGFRPTLDRLYYLVGLLSEMHARNRRIGSSGIDEYLSFVSLSSQILKPKIHNYQMYLEYLIDAGVLECDNQYIVGGKSKGYRLTSTYRTSGRLQPIDEPNLFDDTRKLRDDVLVDSTLKVQYDLLMNLELDYTGAMQYLNDCRASEIEKSKEKKHAAIHLRYNSFLVMIKNFFDKNIYIGRDDYSGRIHSNLTNIKSEYRHFLKYQGCRLVSIDLSNTMALITLMLLRLDFYEETESNLVTFKNINSESLYNLKFFDINTDKYLYSIMCGSLKTPAIEEELAEFSNIVTSGKFYETMVTHFAEYHDVYYSREQVKNLMFLVLYCRSDETRDSILFKKTLFDECYPTIGAILNGWRELGESNLPMLLQRVEAHIFLDCILPRISERCGDIPIFTLHDSIITLEEFVDEVQNIMYEVILEKTGVSCALKTEMWSPDMILKD